MSPPTVSRRLLTVAASTIFAIVAGGCGGVEGGTGTPSPAGLAASTADGSPGTPADDTTTENTMQIQITIGEQRFGAQLTDTAATRDLAAQLPVTIDMVDHGRVEKTGPLPSPLSVAGQPDGADPDVGDLGYYAPGNDLVLYYGDQSYFPGIVILGRLDGDAAQRISALKGPVTARVEARDE